MRPANHGRRFRPDTMRAAHLGDLPPAPTLVHLTPDAFAVGAADAGIPYEVPRDRCRTPAELLGWLHHLSAKGWFTSRHARQLIEAASRAGVRVDFGA